MFHLGLASEVFLLLCLQPFVRDMSKLARAHLALEAERDRLEKEAIKARGKISSVLPVFVDCASSVDRSDRSVFLLYLETAARFLEEKDDAQKQVAALKKELESAKKESQEAAEKQRRLHEEKLAQMTAREAELERRLRAANASLSGKCDALYFCTVSAL